MITGAILVGLLGLAAMPDLYQGSFVVLVKQSEAGRRLGASLDASQRMVANEMQILQSPGLIYRVVQAFDYRDVPIQGNWDGWFPGWIPPAKSARPQAMVMQSERLTDYLFQRLTVRQVEGSGAIQVLLSHPDPQFLLEVIQEFRNHYFRYRAEMWRNTNTDSVADSVADAEAFSKASAEYEVARAELQKLQDILHELENGQQAEQLQGLQDKDKLQKRMADNTDQINQLQQIVLQRQNQSAQLKKLSGDQVISFMEEETEKDNVFRELKTVMGQNMAKRNQLLQSFRPDSMTVLKVEREIQSLAAEYKKMLRNYLGQALLALQGRIEVLDKDIEVDRNQFTSLNAMEIRLHVLRNDIAIQQRKIAVYAEKRAELRGDPLLDVAVGLLAPPDVGDIPIWSWRGFIFLLCGLWGGVVGWVVVISLPSGVRLRNMWSPGLGFLRGFGLPLKLGQQV